MTMLEHARRARRRCAGALAAALLVLALPCAPAAAEEPAIVFAAASLRDVMQAIAKEGGFDGQVAFSFASSSTLARQIEQGAPAQVFISADEAWMDAAVKSGRMQPATRRDWAGNRLALIAPGGDEPATPPDSAEAVTKLLRATLAQPDARIAAGDPSHVPAGKYAKAALTTLGLWADVQPRLARADNVRNALALVERGEAPLGITYRTDALESGKAKVVALFPLTSHPPIVYPVALLEGAGPVARRFYDYLFGPQARAALQAAGFAPPP